MNIFKKLIRRFAKDAYYKHFNQTEIIADIAKRYAKSRYDVFNTWAELGERLLVVYGLPDYAKITFAQLGDWTYTQPEEKSPEKQDQFYKECQVLKENAVLKEIRDSFIEQEKEYLLLQSSGHDQNFKRGEISGVMRLFQLIEGYATQASSPDLDAEEIDPNSPI